MRIFLGMLSRRPVPLWLAAAAMLSLLLTVQVFRDPDVWWHLALGRYITDHGIPSAEPFSFVAPARAWVGQQWLYELSLARIVDAGGPGLASLVMGLLGTSALVLAALSTPGFRTVPGPWAAACLLGSALVAGQVLGVRGQVISVLGVAAVLFILSRWRQGHARVVWALPPLLLLWSNLHAGFIAGLIIPLVVLTVHRPARSVTTVGEGDRQAGGAGLARRPLLAAIAAAGAATLLTPAGFELYPYVAQTFTTPTLTQHIVEWMSPNFHELYPRLLEVEVLLLVAVWLAGNGPEPVDGVLAGGAFLATLQAQRNVALFSVIALPQLLRHGADAWQRHRPRPASPLGPRHIMALLVGTTAVGVGVVLAIAPGLTRQAAADYEAATYPRAAIDYVQAHLGRQRMYTTYEMGGYLAERIPKGRVVFLYGESAVFGESGLQRYLGIHLLRAGWPGVLKHEGLDHAVLPLMAPEASALRELGWSVDCVDTRSGNVVLSRSTGAHPPPVAC
ncbi:MAG: hypothetical protein ABR532_08345 [Candidatus Dormibacteria bacterium]